ncbi:group II intron maturase-specific domain-containing protein [Streptomyces microflavus]
MVLVVLLRQDRNPGIRDSTNHSTAHHRHHGRANWRIVRYADDFVVLVDGCRDVVARLREDIADVLHPLGLRLSPAKTQIVHMSDGFDFLGFHIQWRRKRGSNKWYVYTFIAERPIRQLKDKVRALTNRTSQQDPGTVLKRINSILRGWVNYFKHAVCKTTLKNPGPFRMATGDQLVDGAAPLEVEGRTSTLH